MAQSEVEGLRALRSGFLYIIIAGLIAIVGGVMFIPAASMLASSEFTTAIGTMVVAGILIIIALAIMLYAIFGKVRPGFRALANLDNRFKISYTGTTLLIIGLAIGIIGFLILIGGATMDSASVIYSGLVVYSIAALIVYVGNILALVIGGIRLGRKYNEGLFTVAGILFIFGGLGFISSLLMYIGLGSVLKRLGAQ